MDPLVNVTDTVEGSTVYSILYGSLFWPWHVTKAVTTWTVRTSWRLTSLFVISPTRAIFNWITAPFGFVIGIFFELEPLLLFLLYAVVIGLVAGAIIAITTELIMALASAITPERGTKIPVFPVLTQEGHKLAITPGSASGTSSLSFDSDDDPWTSTTTRVSPKTQFLIPSSTAGIRKRNPQGLQAETIHEESSLNATDAHSSSASSAY